MNGYMKKQANKTGGSKKKKERTKMKHINQQIE